MQTPDRGNHVVEQLLARSGRMRLRLGERFTAFVKNGQVVENVEQGRRHRK